MKTLVRFALHVGALSVGAAVVLLGGCNTQTAPGASASEHSGVAAVHEPTLKSAADDLVFIDPPAKAGAFAPGIFATRDSVLLVWMEPVATPNAQEQPRRRQLRWSEWTEQGWSAPETIVAGEDFFANWADTPMIARDSKGRTLVSFARKSGADTYAYDVVLARKDAPDVDWTVLGSPHRDNTPTEHGFVSMVPRRDGVQVVWLDGRHYAAPSKGPMTLRTAFVGDEIQEGAELDGRVCDCCNTAAALVDQRLLVLYRDRDQDEFHDMAFVQETAQGWSAPRSLHVDGWNIAGCPVNGPAVHNAQGQIWAAWYTGADEKSTIKASVADPGSSFKPPFVVAQSSGQDAPLGRVAVASLNQDEVVVVWLAGLSEGAVWRARRLSSHGRLGASVDIVPAIRAHKWLCQARAHQARVDACVHRRQRETHAFAGCKP